MNIFKQLIAKNVSITCIFNERILFNNPIQSSFSSLSECSQKAGIQMLVTKCLFKIPLWREIDNATFYFFNISRNNLKWMQHFYIDTSWNYLLLNMAVWWGYISRRGRGRGGQWGTDEQPLSDKLPLIRCGETCSTRQ